jgi:hypothetical protein
MHQKSNHCLLHIYVNNFDTVKWHFVQCSYFETGFGTTLRFIIHKYAKLLLYFVEGCLLFLIQTSEATKVHVTCLMSDSGLKYHDTCTC